jgi:hypothetical protein
MFAEKEVAGEIAVRVLPVIDLLVRFEFHGSSQHHPVPQFRPL